MTDRKEPKLDILQPLPSNLDVLPRERLQSYAKDLGLDRYLNVEREKLIIRIRKEHLRKRLLEIRKVETRDRQHIPRHKKKHWAEKRLMKDLKEIQSANLDYVCAQPLRNNLYEWHVNLLAPKGCRYFPMILHLILTFSEDYPLKPPKCKIITDITHSHVFSNWGGGGGKWVCLDMLETHGSSKAYYGWSSSYSVLSILFQLQSFLFEDEDTRRDYSSSQVKDDIFRSTKISCNCGHDPSKSVIFPKWSYWGKSIKRTYFRSELTKENYLKVGKSKKRRKKKGEEGVEEEEEENEEELSKRQLLYSQIPNEVMIYIFQFLDRRVILRFSRISKLWRKISFHPYLWKDELKCFHTKSTFREDTLGLGLNIQKKFRKIHQVSTPLDVIGKNAFFQQKVKKSPWNLPFSHFMPLFIDEKHWGKSRQDFEDLVTEIYFNPPREGKKNKNQEKEEEEEAKVLDDEERRNREERRKVFKPHQAVDFCCKLMTSMVVEIMKGELHASIKAIQGYAYFFRILIYYVTKFPHIRNEIDYNIGKFIQHERFRHKKFVPNLGDFICLLSVSKLFTWEDVRTAFIDEVFDRNSFWMSKKFDILLAEEDAKRGGYRNIPQRRGENRREERVRAPRPVVQSVNRGQNSGYRTNAEQDRKRRYRARVRKRKAEMKRLSREDPGKYNQMLEERRRLHEMLHQRKEEKKVEEEEKQKRKEREEFIRKMEERRKKMEKKRLEEEKKRKRNEKMRKNIRVSFKCVETSLKFTLFHLCFLKRIRKGNRTIEKIGRRYDQRFGSEHQTIEKKLQLDIFEVSKMKSFLTFAKSGCTKIFSSIKDNAEESVVKREKVKLVLEKLSRSEKNFYRRRYNRRIDTSGSVLTGRFDRSENEVKKMVRYRDILRKRDSVDSASGEEEEEEEIEGESEVEKKKVSKRDGRIGGRGRRRERVRRWNYRGGGSGWGRRRGGRGGYYGRRK